jgi:peptide/nickel transport system substrate-binding protein
VLAAADQSPDHLITVKLRTDAHWQDGVPVTAKDVKFTLDKVRDPKIPAINKAGYFEKLDRLEVVDDHTLVFVWKEAFAPALFAITQLWPIPEHVYGTGDFLTHPANRKPVGNGPFMLDEWVSSQYLSLVRYDGYYGRKAHLDRIIFKVVEDDAVALNMLKAGELDEMGNVQWEKQNRSRLRARFRKVPTSRLQLHRWNCRSVVSDSRVRRAMTLLFDRESVNTKIYSGYARLVSGPFYINSWAYDKTVKPLPFDPAAAKALLEEAGWKDTNQDGVREKNGKRFEFELNIISGSAPAAQFSQLLQEECGKAGVRVNIRQLEGSSFFDRIDKGEFDAAMLGWRLDLDPDVFDTFHSSMTPPNGLNHGFYSNREVDSLLVAGRAEFDPAKRAAIYHRVHRIMADEQPYTFINAVPDKRPIAFSGITISPMGLDFWPGANYWWIDKSGPRGREALAGCCHWRNAQLHDPAPAASHPTLSASHVTFIIVNLAPGDPVELINRGEWTRIARGVPQMLELWAHQPVHVRYFTGSSVCALDFGIVPRPSSGDGRSGAAAGHVVAQLTSLLISLMLAVPLGLYAAFASTRASTKWAARRSTCCIRCRNSGWRFCSSCCGREAQLLHQRRKSSTRGPRLLRYWWDRFLHMILPTFCLTYGSMAFLSRFVRGSSLEIIRQDYIRTARAKGLDEARIVYTHVFRNTLIPVLTLLGLLLPTLISGSIILESIFSWPGVGNLFFGAVLARDYPVVMGLSTITAVVVLFSTLIADLLYAWADPRVTYR